MTLLVACISHASLERGAMASMLPQDSQIENAGTIGEIVSAVAEVDRLSPKDVRPAHISIDPQLIGTDQTHSGSTFDVSVRSYRALRNAKVFLGATSA